MRSISISHSNFAQQSSFMCISLDSIPCFRCCLFPHQQKHKQIYNYNIFNPRHACLTAPYHSCFISTIAYQPNPPALAMWMKYERNTKTASGSTKVSEHETYNFVGKCNAVFSMSPPLLLFTTTRLGLVLVSTVLVWATFVHSLHAFGSCFNSMQTKGLRAIQFQWTTTSTMTLSISFVRCFRETSWRTHKLELMKKKKCNKKTNRNVFVVVSPQCNFYLNCTLLSY